MFSCMLEKYFAIIDQWPPTIREARVGFFLSERVGFTSKIFFLTEEFFFGQLFN